MDIIYIHTKYVCVKFVRIKKVHTKNVYKNQTTSYICGVKKMTVASCDCNGLIISLRQKFNNNVKGTRIS